MKFRITPVQPGKFHLEIMQMVTITEVTYKPRIRKGIDKFLKYKRALVHTTEQVEREDIRTISAKNDFPKIDMPHLNLDGLGIYWEAEPAEQADYYNSYHEAKEAAEKYKDYIENYPKPSKEFEL